MLSCNRHPVHDAEADLTDRFLGVGRGLMAQGQVVRDDEVPLLPVVGILDGAAVLQTPTNVC